MHFIADFILQSGFMAKYKSRSNAVLLFHVCVYGIPFFYFGYKFALFNMAAHFATDYISSRVTSLLWKQNSVHWFFVIIGLDQAIHLTTLILSLEYFK